MKPTVSLESMLGAQRGDPPAALIPRYLAEARRQLGMEVAYVAEFRDGQRIYRFIEGETIPDGVRVGTGDPLEDTFAQRVIEGSVDAVPDVARDPALASLVETRSSRIASFVGVPLRLGVDDIYGILACQSSTPTPSLDDRAVSFLHVFGRLILDQLDKEQGEWDDLRRQIERVEQALQPGSIGIEFQPVFDIRSDDGRLVGAEALARFELEPQRSPDVWFAEAWTVGRGVDLELASVEAAVAHLGRLPQGTFLAINVAAETVVSPRLPGILAGVPRDRVVLEIPE
ncbi:MAG TPA: EAL domain-containing protein, partial [Actinomycetota bacterium]|nr:EAL domain-containing protein [Actinomycetota bacterium]